MIVTRWIAVNAARNIHGIPVYLPGLHIFKMDVPRKLFDFIIFGTYPRLFVICSRPQGVCLLLRSRSPVERIFVTWKFHWRPTILCHVVLMLAEWPWRSTHSHSHGICVPTPNRCIWMAYHSCHGWNSCPASLWPFIFELGLDFGWWIFW